MLMMPMLSIIYFSCIKTKQKLTDMLNKLTYLRLFSIQPHFIINFNCRSDSFHYLCVALQRLFTAHVGCLFVCSSIRTWAQCYKNKSYFMFIALGSTPMVAFVEAKTMEHKGNCFWVDTHRIVQYSDFSF